MTNSERAVPLGGIVLAGGSSSRLGRDKATLDWHGTPLAERVARLLARGIGGGPVVIAVAHGGGTPSGRFPCAVDRIPDGGPLVGLSAGIDAIRGEVEAVVAVPCDLPLLHPAVVRALANGLLVGSCSSASPAADDGMPLPIPGAWRTSVADRLRAAIDGGERSPRRFANEVGHTRVEPGGSSEVAESDPDLDSLRDVDSPEDLQSLSARAPKVRVARDGRIATVEAWTLGEACSATGGDPEGPCVLNGLPVEFDPRLPLARRDAISLPPSTG